MKDQDRLMREATEAFDKTSFFMELRELFEKHNVKDFALLGFAHINDVIVKFNSGTFSGEVDGREVAHGILNLISDGMPEGTLDAFSSILVGIMSDVKGDAK